MQKIVALFFLAAPLATFAQSEITRILGDATAFLNLVVTFLILLATVIFLWGIIKYILAGGDEEKVKEARHLIIWGIIFLAVMVGVWGFVNIVLDFLFSSDSGNIAPIPFGPQQ